MYYYENSKGKIIGRLYECNSGWIAEIGSYNPAAICKFFANHSFKFKTYRKAEDYLYKYGCVSAVVL